MRRLIILLCGALLALMVVAPGVSARSSSGQSADLAKLAAGWWKWAVKKPSEVSPLLGDYSWKEQPQGAAKCAGGSRLGVFNLAGEFTLDENAGGGSLGQRPAPANYRPASRSSSPSSTLFAAPLPTTRVTCRSAPRT
jgi:hypothetical protein